MAEIRFNYGDKFTQTTNTNTGIGSTIPTAKLDIAGGTSAGSLRVSGIATLPSYQGFINTKLNTPTEGMIVEAGQSGSVSGEVVVGTGQTISVSTGATTGQGGIDSLKVYKTFTPPVGGTADRPTDVKPGMVYYNKDFKTIEFWDGNFWKQVDNTTRSGRGVFGGGYHPGFAPIYAVKNIEHLSIPTKGNSNSFGDLVEAQGLHDALSSSTRMVFSAGYNPGFGGYAAIDMEYITMASEGNAIDFGDQLQGTYGTGACSSSTRGLIMGGNRMPTNSPFDDGNDGNNVICTIEISTIGNAIDFGDLTQRRAYPASCGSTVRAVIMGGYNNAVGAGGLQGSDTVLFSSHGNAVDFGDAVEAGALKAGSNSVRGVFAGSNGGSQTFTNVIQYVSLQSLGNATDFGDRTYEHNGACMSSQTRLVMAGGRGSGSPSTGSNVIDFVEIATTGNAQDFGDAGYLPADNAGSSDCHGGLGGF